MADITGLRGAPPSPPQGARLVISIHLLHSFTREKKGHMVIVTLRQIIDERISFLIEQINPANKPQINKTFQLQIDVIRSASNDLEKFESLILQKKALLKRSNDIHELDKLFAELDGLEWLQRQIARYF